MNLQALRAVLRLEYLDDSAAPLLWQDFQLDRFINEACAEAALRSHCVRDRLTLPLLAGQADYPLPPSALFLFALSVDGGGRLSRCALSDLERIPGWAQRTGRPAAFVFDSIHEGGEGVLRLYPKPTQAMTLAVRYARMPATLADDNDEPEIPQALQPHLLDYAASRAFALRDADAGESALSLQHAARFTQRFGAALTPQVLAARQSGKQRQIRINPEWR